MSAQPVHLAEDDPNDPQRILRDLPDQERPVFLRHYREAIEAAKDPAGYRVLQQVLHGWSVVAVATTRPGYYEDLERARQSLDEAVPVEEIVPDWTERAAVIRARRTA